MKMTYLVLTALLASVSFSLTTAQYKFGYMDIFGKFHQGIPPANPSAIPDHLKHLDLDSGHKIPLTSVRQAGIDFNYPMSSVPSGEGRRFRTIVEQAAEKKRLTDLGFNPPSVAKTLDGAADGAVKNMDDQVKRISSVDNVADEATENTKNAGTVMNNMEDGSPSANLMTSAVSPPSSAIPDDAAGRAINNVKNVADEAKATENIDDAAINAMKNVGSDKPSFSSVLNQNEAMRKSFQKWKAATPSAKNMKNSVPTTTTSPSSREALGTLVKATNEEIGVVLTTIQTRVSSKMQQLPTFQGASSTVKTQMTTRMNGLFEFWQRNTANFKGMLARLAEDPARVHLYLATAMTAGILAASIAGLAYTAQGAQAKKDAEALAAVVIQEAEAQARAKQTANVVVDGEAAATDALLNEWEAEGRE